MSKLKISLNITPGFPKCMPPGRLLYTARAMVGMTRKSLARRMGMDEELLAEYESGTRQMPNTMLLKLFLFGLDMWTECPPPRNHTHI